MDREGYSRLVGTDGAGEVLGFADYAHARCHLRYLFVDPAAQGRGLGGKLVDAVQAALGAEPITLTCFAVNDRALAWYLRHGFQITGGGFMDLAGREVVEIYLRRALVRPAS